MKTIIAKWLHRFGDLVTFAVLIHFAI